MRLDAIDMVKAAALPRKATAAAAALPDAAAQPLDKEALKNAVKTANEIAAQNASEVEFSVDSDGGGIVVRVLNRNTKEVIRQFPSEDLLKLRHALETLRGLMLDKKA